jgi:hypothetical protein
MKPKYRAVPFSLNRRAAAASAAVAAKRSTISATRPTAWAACRD